MSVKEELACSAGGVFTHVAEQLRARESGAMHSTIVNQHLLPAPRKCDT
jgi:hypothetical protein